MKIAGVHDVAAPREQVWRALQDPEVLVRTIPGCVRLERVDDDAYRMTVEAGVASIRGVYTGSVALSDQVPDEAYTLRASGQGAPGTVDATARVTLDENGDGTTRVRYDCDAVVGGTIGGVGQRMVSSVARRTAGEFFEAVETHLTGAVPAEVPAEAPGPAEAPAPAGAPGEVFRAPPRPAAAAPHPLWLLAAALAGAAIALAGVALGRRSG